MQPEVLQIVATTCAVVSVIASAFAAWAGLHTRVAVQELEIRMREKLEQYARKDDLKECTTHHRELTQDLLQRIDTPDKPDWWQGFIQGMKEKRQPARHQHLASPLPLLKEPTSEPDD